MTDCVKASATSDLCLALVALIYHFVYVYSDRYLKLPPFQEATFCEALHIFEQTTVFTETNIISLISKAQGWLTCEIGSFYWYCCNKL